MQLILKKIRIQLPLVAPNDTLPLFCLCPPDTSQLVNNLPLEAVGRQILAEDCRLPYFYVRQLWAHLGLLAPNFERPLYANKARTML